MKSSRQNLVKIILVGVLLIVGYFIWHQTLASFEAKEAEIAVELRRLEKLQKDYKAKSMQLQQIIIEQKAELDKQKLAAS